jgi:hypothetical protein
MGKQTKIGPVLRGIAYFVTPALVLGAIWYAVIIRYYMPTPVITHEMIERGRQVPSDAVLDELSRYRFFYDENRLFSVGEAEKLLRGEFIYPGEAPQSIHLPFDPHDIDQGSPTWQLFHARLIIPRMMLAAYRETGREEFFATARDVILGWASYERRAFVPKGDLWFDHAIAERVLALAEFWSFYRHHASYDADVAEALFVFAARSRAFLADPSFYYRLSNHGVMQDLALWHLSLAFPSLPDTPRYTQLAFERLGKLMGFYIDEQGFVLEHSAGYHRTGVQFVSLAVRYMTLLGIDVPSEWRQKFEKAKEVYARLRRPDGSLPMFGDTEGGIHLPGPVRPMSEQEGLYGPLTRRLESVQPQTDLYPVAGYSIWWDGVNRPEDLSQTVVAWSYFPGFAHKHADEMSVLLWARGQTWWTNVGYWPYGPPERRDAESWNGSNAPHVTGESAVSLRKTRLLGEAHGKGFSFIDLERRGPQGYIARRQVIQAINRLWVVLDHTLGDVKDHTATLWTTAHDIQMREGRFPGSYDLTHPSNKSVLRTFVFGSSGTNIQKYRGSRTPFAGWQMAEEAPKPASAIMIDQPAHNSWAVAIWLFDDTVHQGTPAMPSMSAWNGPENWTISLPTELGMIQLSRDADGISFKGGSTTVSTHLIPARLMEIDRKIVEIRSARDRAKQEYPRPRVDDAVEYRFRVTYLVFFLFALQEVFFVIYRKFTSNRYALLRGLSVIAWVMMGIWLVVIRTPLI